MAAPAPSCEPRSSEPLCLCGAMCPSPGTAGDDLKPGERPLGMARSRRRTRLQGCSGSMEGNGHLKKSSRS